MLLTIFFKVRTKDLSHLQEIDQKAVQEELSAESFIDSDNIVVTNVPNSSDDEDTVTEILDPQ